MQVFNVCTVQTTLFMSVGFATLFVEYSAAKTSRIKTSDIDLDSLSNARRRCHTPGCQAPSSLSLQSSHFAYNMSSALACHLGRQQKQHCQFSYGTCCMLSQKTPRRSCKCQVLSLAETVLLLSLQQSQQNVPLLAVHILFPHLQVLRPPQASDNCCITPLLSC